LEGKVRRENTFVLNANRRSIWENRCDACAFGFEDGAYATQVVDGVGTDRAGPRSRMRCGPCLVSRQVKALINGF
jgi:hypothetical protein